MSGGPARPLSRRGRRLRWTVSVLVAVALVGSAAGVAIYRGSRTDIYRPGEELDAITEGLVRDLPPEAPEPAFADVTADAGLGSFRSFAGHRTSQLPEDMGSGAAWGDLDNDGDEDLVLVASGGPLGAPAEQRARTELYENLGDGTFRRVESFPDTRIVGMGAAWGDCDGDGRLDLIVTGYDSLRLYRNRMGTLVRDSSFPEPAGFWAGAAWGDFDNDRDLDLYVSGYVRYIESDAGRARVSQQYGRAVPYTLNPSSFPPERNLLFRNDGNGGFTEVAQALGVDNTAGRSLGALWHDLDDDGWLDLYVANDISDNVLFYNRRGTFEEISHAAWVADYRGAMGLAAGDWNRDGDDDLFVSHWVAQENALYDSQLVDRAGAGSGGAPVQFVDVADQRGVGQIALRTIGWGAEFTDLDADGWLDLVVAQGSTFETEESPRWLRPQQTFLFWNRMGEHFHDLAQLSATLREPHVGRGLAVADYDDDGDPDLVLVLHGEGAQLLRNDMVGGGWIKLRLRSLAPDGSPSGFGDGARVALRVGDTVMRRTVSSASYLSQSSRILHFGLGESDGAVRAEVRWLGGETEVIEGLAAGATWEITEGDPTPRRLSRGPNMDRAQITEFWSHQRAAMRALKVERNIDRAVEELEQALAIDPRHEDALYYLAHCRASRGENAEAIALLETLADVNHQSHRAFKSLGILRATDAPSPDDLTAASAALERALALNPEETGALLAIAEIDLMRGRLTEAEHRLELANRTNPQAVGGYFLRGYIAWKGARPGPAVELLAAAREALGPEWTPRGMTSEGDVRDVMHVDRTPLSRFWQEWDGVADPQAAFAALDAELKRAGA